MTNEKKEARYLQDIVTLDKNNKTDGLFTEQDLQILNVLPENYRKWKKEFDKKKPIDNPEEIFKPQGQVKFYIERQPIFYDKNDLWWVWNHNQKKWEISNEVDILNHIQEITGDDIISPKNRTLILNSLKQECRKSIPKDIKPTWIQFKDKIFDIKTGECFEASPDYLSTNPIPWKMHNGNYEETPTMDRIFEEWVGKEHVQTLYEIIAYCLIPAYPINRLFCFIGGGMNGKTCYLNLLQKFLGKENVCTTELDTLITSRFEITRLHKKLACLMGETNFDEMNKTSWIKKLTGGDLIGFEYKNKPHFHDYNYAKILIATNNLPTTTDKTLGFYRRWMIIDFPNKFSEKKDILADIPDEEYEALALKCTGILHDLLVNRRFHNEGSVEERMERYEAKSDFLQKFLDEFTVEKVNEHITKADFYKKFRDWCKENRHREMAENTLGKKMKSKGIEAGKFYVNWLHDGRGGQMKVWLDRKWKD
jgi:P4 family phage/plasmid primase-like protien